MFLYGFGPVLLAGTIQTIELSVLSLAAAVLLGLAGAAAKLSFNRPLRMLGTGYTTLIRSVPDLVLMLLLFYSIQIAAQRSDRRAQSADQFDIDPFVGRRHHARLHLRRVFHRDVPRRLPRGAARPARSGRAPYGMSGAACSAASCSRR